MNNLNKQLEFWASENFGVLDESVTRDTVGIVHIFANLFSKCALKVFLSLYGAILFTSFFIHFHVKSQILKIRIQKEKIVKCVICAS